MRSELLIGLRYVVNAQVQDPKESPHSRRGNRAMALIGLAVIVIAAAGAIYLHSSASSQPQATSSAVDRSIVSARPVDYDFLTATVGWALVVAPNEPTATGRFWIFESRDGAKHWQQEFSAQSELTTFSPTTFSPSSVQFVDGSHGFVYIGGSPGQLYRTADGGAHWTSQHLPVSQVYEVAFTDATHGWLLSAGNAASIQTTPFFGPFQLFATSDSGVNWSQLPDTPASASVGVFRSATEAWTGGLGFGKPFVYISSDAGQSWHRRFIPSPPGQSWDGSENGGGQILLPSSVNLLPGQGVVADVMDSGEQYLFTSFDAGQTWQYVAPPVGVVAYEDSIHWWAIAGNTLFKSSDAGQSWNAVSHSAPTSLRGVRVSDSQHAWGVTIESGGYGLVVTSDGGQRWTRAQVPRLNQP